MKKILLLLIIISIFSCKKDSVTKTQVPNKTLETEAKIDVYAKLYGNWVGDFIAVEYDESKEFVEVNKINLVLKKITNNRVFGSSNVSGNSRAILGILNENKNEFQFILNEPGDDKYDGKFDFTIKGDSLIGFWSSFDKKLPVTKRSFKLIKQDFIYNPKLMLPNEGDYVDYFSHKNDSVSYEYDGKTEYEYSDTYRMASDVISKINASTTKLQEIDLKNLKKLELEIIRNTIFARHGFTFKKKSYRQFFDPVAWYVPVSNNVSNELTVLEKENILLLNRFEKYAEDNYDSFGR